MDTECWVNKHRRWEKEIWGKVKSLQQKKKASETVNASKKPQYLERDYL